MHLMTDCFKVLPILPGNNLGYFSKIKLWPVIYGNGLINYLFFIRLVASNMKDKRIIGLKEAHFEEVLTVLVVDVPHRKRL